MDTLDVHVADPLLGELVAGRYRVTGRLTRPSRVAGTSFYQAHDELLDRDVTIKIANPDHADDPEVAQRLVDEAEAAARLAHPNMVAIFGRGTHQGAPYLVLEFVRGRALNEVLADRRRLDPAESLAILEQILAALAVAHRAGLAHREISPESILVTPPPNGSGDLVDAVVKVLDIGLARPAEITRASPPAGPPDHVAPELLTEGRADTRVDVYSTGILLYQMLTGRVPPLGEPVPPPSRMASGVPPLLDDLVTRATRHDPAQRPPDAAAMLGDIQSAREDVGALAGPTRAFAPPTVVVPSVDDDSRPSWARLHTTPASPATAARRAARGTVRRAAVASDWLRTTRAGRRTLVASLLVLGLVLVSGGWWLGFGRFTTAPSLISLTRDNAVAQAARLGFTVDFDAGRYSEVVPADTVLDQQPAAGARIVRGGTVALVVSLGPERYPVPDVAGENAQSAANALGQHFVVATRDGFSDTLPVGYVVALDPPVGTALPPNSTVTIIVARGPFPLHIPSVVGKTSTTAQQQLAALGFTDIVIQQRDDTTHPKNTVLDQTPPAGQGLTGPAGVTITLVVASGPAATPMPNVVGAKCTTARAQLEGLGLDVQVDGTGTVTEQVPTAGIALEDGQAVEIRCES